MKKKMVFTTLVAMLLFGCGAVGNDSAEANLEDSFVKISTTNFGSLNIIYELKHKETGCHYAVTYVGDSGSIEQMYIEKNGVTVPYCD